MSTNIQTNVQPRISEHYREGEHGRMRYWLSTPTHGRPILFIHGYGGLIEHWRRVLPPLARSHTVAALDLYGFGYSAQPREISGSALWSRQVAAFVRQVLPGPAVVVGHSLGGMVAAQVAHDYPELVQGLVLVNSAGLPPSREPSAFDRAFFGLVQTSGLGELLAGVFANEWGVRQSLRSAYYREECVTDELVELFSAPLRRRDGIRSYLAVTRALANSYLDISPGAVQVPTLLLWGEHDQSLPPSVAHAFKQRMFPQAEIQIVPESGHCPFDEAADVFSNKLLGWLNRIKVDQVDQAKERVKRAS